MDLEHSFFTNKEFIEYVWPDFSNMKTNSVLYYKRQCSDNVAGMIFYELHSNNELHSSNRINNHW
jgi:hypothetical protein